MEQFKTKIKPEAFLKKVLNAKAAVPFNCVVIKDGTATVTNTFKDITVSVPMNKPDGVYRFVGKNLDLTPYNIPEVGVPDFEGDVVLTLDNDFLKDVRNAFGSAAKADNRLFMTGVSLVVKDETLQVFGTDGHTLFLSKRMAPGTEDFQVTFSPDLVSVMLLDMTAPTVKLVIGCSATRFETGNVIAVGTNIQCDLPNVNVVVPKHADFLLLLDKETLKTALDELMPYAKESVGNRTTVYKWNPDEGGSNLFTIGTKDVVTQTIVRRSVKAEVFEGGSLHQDKVFVLMPMLKEDDHDAIVALDAKLWLRAINSTEGSSVWMAFNDCHAAILVTSDNPVTGVDLKVADIFGGQSTA